jgi:diguanylate cyclase (GGDEF)-like protein
MTSLSDSLDKVKGFELGAVDYITKPFDRDEVMARVKTHLHINHLTRQIQEQNQKLQDFNLELEDRVQKRTMDLSNAVEALQALQVELLQREQRLAHEAVHDTLTGLPNRAWLMERLHYLIAQKHLYAVLFMDLDRFKVINDSLGHLVGDELLKQATQRITALISTNATLARFGGDEFIILLEDITDLEAAISLAKTIQSGLEAPFPILEHELFVSISIGITINDQDYRKPEDILRDADIAMYQAKNKGRNRYDIFNPIGRNQAIARLEVENDLRKAIERQEFQMYFQPITCLRRNILCGFESLVRWHHPSGKMISPLDFIPIAEDTGMINELGWWILGESLRQMRSWQDQLKTQFGDRPPLWVNVNVSPIQLKQVNFAQGVQQILDEYELPNLSLKLEITESCLLESTGMENQCLADLKKFGIRLCIDDFGTGYSSLSRLHELPIHTLKIDRAFVKDLQIECQNGSCQNSIASTIIKLAHGLNMDVVAEGIETEEQKEVLRSLSCDYGQGYLLSRPLPQDAAYEYISENYVKYHQIQPIGV